jgi:hypothetical protein
MWFARHMALHPACCLNAIAAGGFSGIRGDCSKENAAHARGVFML